VVLGIPFTTDKAAVKRAFARRSRQLRRDGGLPWTQEDLAWAESVITIAGTQPEASVDHYRIPADPSAFEQPRHGDLFVPDSLPLVRQTPLASSDSLDQQCADQLIGELRRWLGRLTPDDTFDPYMHPQAAEEGGVLEA
jgi:hypothetical protein